MNLKNRFRLVIISMVLLLISMAIIVTIGIRHTSMHVREAISMDDLVVDLYELRILNSEYAATPSDRVIQQWQTNYEQIRNRITNQRNIPDDVKDAMNGLQEIFTKLISMPEGTEPSQKRLRNQIATTLNLESQRVIEWASEISGQTKNDIVPHLIFVGTAMLFVILSVALVTVTIMIVTTRRIFSSFRRLKEGAEKIAAGMLGFQIENTGRDEIALLGNSINRMSCHLMESYNDLHEQTVHLETEMAEKQLINEELQIKTAELEKEIEERQVMQEKLKEQTVVLEEEISERTKIQEKHQRLEEQLLQSQKMEAIGLLAGGVAHDFNNFLSVIMGYGDLLMGALPDGKMHENAHQILKASERAADLTKALLAFSRKQTFNLEQTDINQLARDNIKFLKRLIGEDIELRTSFYPSLLYLMVDRSQIQQVFMNLATNARDAMPSGGSLTIGIAPEMLDDSFIATQGYGNPGEYAVVRVTDTGNGMDKDTVKRIFEPFFTTKEKGKGTGLGLSIIHGIIAQHNGFITCRSLPGEGTTFSIYLPLSENYEEALAQPVRIVRDSPRGSETILLAEDDRMLLEVTANHLESNGYKVLQASDGAEAVEIFRREGNRIDLVILDAIMPKMTGKQAWNEIRDIRPDVKACFISGYTSEFISGKLAVDFSVPFIGKPVMPAVLMKKVREILDA